MRIVQAKWEPKTGWSSELGEELREADLVLAFGCRKALEDADRFAEVRSGFPESHIFCASTSGEIHGDEVLDHCISLTAIQFEHTQIRTASVELKAFPSRRDAGEFLARELMEDDLGLVFVLADGQNVNGSALVEGMNKVLREKVPVTGGLAGDGASFRKTLVGLNAAPQPGMIVAFGLYGDRIKVGHGSMGGWDTFGPKREVTRSEGNVLFELDGCSALKLYKDYLGERAAELPGSALLFPLQIISDSETDPGLVRTVLTVDGANESMTFAGDIPQGAKVQLMKANFDRLIDGAVVAAEKSLVGLASTAPELAILISCVGRRLILGQRVEEEVENAHAILGANVAVTGFYSYGEISPVLGATGCSLHNQTMTITTLYEQ